MRAILGICCLAAAFACTTAAAEAAAPLIAQYPLNESYVSGSVEYTGDTSGDGLALEATPGSMHFDTTEGKLKIMFSIIKCLQIISLISLIFICVADASGAVDVRSIDSASGNSLREISVDVLARDVAVEEEGEHAKREPLDPTNNCVIM